MSRATEATPVRRHHVPVVLQGIDDKLKRRPGVAPAVQIDQHGTGVAAPFADMVVHATQDMADAAALHAREVALSHGHAMTR